MRPFILTLTILCIFVPRTLHGRTITVGVYDNYPKVFVDKEGKPAGIFIDILEYIAKQENWDIKYKTYLWQDGLDALEKGEIDLMPDVSLTDERSKKLTFSQISVLSSWLQIYQRYNVSMKTIQDLQGKKIAVLRGSVQEIKIKEIVEQLKLNCQIMIYDDYISTEKSVINGVTDGVVAGNFYEFAISSSGAKKIVPSPLIFSPSTLHYAVPLHKNKDIIEAIDYHLSRIKNQYPSIFQEAHYKWLGARPQTIIPRYIFYIIICISVSLFIALILIFVMYVKKMHALKRLQESESKYHSIFEQAPLCIAHMDQKGRFVDVNNQVLNIFGYSKDEFLKLGYRDVFPLNEQDGEKDNHEDEMQRFLKGEKEDLFKETMLKHKSGENIFVRVFLKSVLSSGKNVVSFICLFEDITERKKFEKKILESLQEKEILLREIHHRVKNNMQVICSLLSLQSDFSKDDKIHEVFNEVNQQIRAMSLAHEMLYQSSSFATFKAKEYITRLVEQIFGKTSNMLKMINLTQDVDDINIGIDVAIPLGFIVTELISNCLKHAFNGRKKGTVSISLHSKKDHMVELIVTDDGVGIPENIDVENPKSLGLELVNIFIQKLNGSVVFARKKVGTSVTVLVKNETT